MSEACPWRAVDQALREADPSRKCAQVAALATLAEQWVASPRPRLLPVEIPGRPLKPTLVPPRALAQRGLGSESGRAALVHAVAHIEFNAINLALDAVQRFDAMPPDFYRDWLSVAVDEARHFGLLNQRLAELGFAYGDFDAHNGLWEMCLKTAGDVLERMALVPRVLEARGLDVTPGMIERLRGAGDRQTVAALEVILREEVRHVAIGTRWFHWACAARGLEPDATFLGLIEAHSAARIKPPFNCPARRAAGFSAREMAALEAL
jgi:uncharacterized ferritin-like protein (DUF455 family)